MIKRVQLTFSRSKDDNIRSYKIYRSLRPNVSQKDTLVMEVEHTLLPTPIRVAGDRLELTEDGYYLSKYKNIMVDSIDHPISVTYNGIPVDQLAIDIGVEGETGVFYFPHTFAPSDELIATYWIDAIRVLDTDETVQKRVKYSGPPARDRTESSIPGNVSLLPEADNGRIRLFWQDAMTAGQAYYYRVEAVDEYGNFSVLSPEEGLLIREGLDVEGYIVERSYDNINWSTVSSQASAEYFEYGIDLLPPDAPVNLIHTDVLDHNFSRANVHLKWEAPGLGSASKSGMYRVRAKTTLGVVSAPSLSVGPVYLTSTIKKYLVRRKIYDGTYPTATGNDAITIATILGNKLEYVDYSVPDATEYAYAIYAVDAAENISLASTRLVSIGDATPPLKVTGFRATAHSYIVFAGDTNAPPKVTGVKVSRHGYILGTGDYKAPPKVTNPKAYHRHFTGI